MKQKLQQMRQRKQAAKEEEVHALLIYLYRKLPRSPNLIYLYRKLGN